MKNLIFCFCILASIALRAQSVGINTDGTTPDASAILDAKSITKGFLCPRMTTTQMNLITTPANGLLIYNTTTNSFWYRKSSTWTEFGSKSFIADTDGNTKVHTETSPNEDIIRMSLGGSERLTLRKNTFGRTLIELPNNNDQTYLGYTAGQQDSIGSANTGIGYKALKYNRSGYANSALGSRALSNNTTGYQNIAIGSDALLFNTIGLQNVAISPGSLQNNSSGIQNIAIGKEALYSNTTSNDNIAIGKEALWSNTAGSNIAIGSSALFYNTTGIDNLALGVNSLHKNVSGIKNIGTGNTALYSNTSGSYNVAYGDQSLTTNTSGYNNTAFGNKSLGDNTTGHNNVAIGYNASYLNTTGDHNVTLGSESWPVSNNKNNFIGIGYYAGTSASISNSVELGNTSITKISGQVNFSTYSDARIKESVKANVPGLSFINKLRPVTYNLNIHKQNSMLYGSEKPDTANWEGKYDIEKKRMTGFIAQEVAQAAKEVGFDFSGIDAPESQKDLYSLRYSEFVVPLVKAVQEQQAQIELLIKDNQALKAQLESQAAILKKITKASKTSGL